MFDRGGYHGPPVKAILLNGQRAIVPRVIKLSTNPPDAARRNS